MRELIELRERIVAASAARRPLRLRGGGSKDFLGQSLDAEVLDTRGWRGITSYEPTELVITARAGTPLSEVEEALADKRQMLAFEPPSFGANATIGGCVAAGLSGPRRAAAGAIRDFVLGAALLDGSGTLKNFGGQVMKNVAGYDVSRLLCGSFGILGLIAEVSLKVLPLPAAELTLSISMDEPEALRALNAWAARPLPISASAWHNGGLRLRLSGANSAVSAALAHFVREYGAVELDPRVGAGFWAGMRDQTSEFFAGDTALWRLSLPSTAPALSLPGPQLIEWGGAQRWLRGHHDATQLRQAAASLGGHATLFRGGDRSVGVFQPLAPAVAALHSRLKREFDPAGIFNPGRMYPDL